MPLDPLAARLDELLTAGSMVASQLSWQMQKRLTALFEFKALAVEKAGGGSRVVVRDREALQRWVSTNYPSGLHGTGEELPARAEAVANFRDSKAGRKLTVLPLYMRGFGDAALTRRAGALPLAALTAAHRLVGVLVDLADPWEFAGTLALVENLELFLHAEDVVPGIDGALWTAGRFDQRALDWIAGMPSCRVVHVGDYDPVGLDEYLRVRAALPRGRASIFVPDDFERRLAAYGKVDLLERSVAVLERVRRTAPRDLRAVLAVMDRHGKALEQEGLMIPMARTTLDGEAAGAPPVPTTADASEGHVHHGSKP
jgi:hypothetical protein